MPSNTVPAELLVLRDQIDSLDEEMVTLLAKRFAVTSEVGKLKAKEHLSSVDPVREQEKLDRLQRLAEKHALNSEFVLELFQMVFDEVVKNHRGYLKS